ncbi:polysaccharide export protein [Alcanivorax quisquiliarum]|uniref:Polysaccharide export protein n=1 Tax=Alcanivorax quisquiliarum TaxID=2933565 RepID=A0ABT0EA29_9GAMM|nr:polysaccharide export protein [Alcanivorax quisquiliarum]MCK0538700.1 polysaccharide export protein [Alcanivorax quisquiliarum]
MTDSLIAGRRRSAAGPAASIHTRRLPRQALRLLLGVSALGWLAGCTLVPGSHISQPSSSPWFNGEQRSDSERLPDIVRVREITPGLPVAAQQAPQPQLPPELERELTHYDYVVGPGDVLNITVWDHPELTIPAGSMRSPSEAGNWVHNDGTIFYPYVGSISVAGLRVTEIRDLITERISRYIENPQVDVSVAAFRSQRVYVSGSVREPGAYPVTNVPMRLLDAVNAAGGLDEYADWRQVILTRDGQDYILSLRAIYERGDARYNVLLRSGDVVHVGRGDDNKVFVLGEVERPNALVMGRNGLTLAEALAESGGINELQANASGVFVMRRAEDIEPSGERYIDLYQLNMKNAAALVLADEFVLSPRDIVYVTAAPVARWNRLISQLLPTVQGLYMGARTERELDR